MQTDDIKQWLDAAQEESLAEAASRQMRAWHRLQPALWGETSHSIGSAPGFWTPRLLNLGAVAVIALTIGLATVLPSSIHFRSGAMAQAQQPDIYATTFYSSQAHADVVWISGLQEAGDTGSRP